MKLGVEVRKVHEDAAIPSYETTSAAGFDFRAYTPNEQIVLPPAKVERVVPKRKDVLGRIVQKIEEFFTGVEYKAIPSRVLVKTGLSVALPQGFELQVRSRSGLALKHGIQAHVGTIDADYRGEIGIILFNFGSEEFVINHYDRIAQGIVNRVEQAGFIEVEELNETERGVGGFGSTGGVASVALGEAVEKIEGSNIVDATTYQGVPIEKFKENFNAQAEAQALDNMTVGVRLC